MDFTFCLFRIIILVLLLDLVLVLLFCGFVFPSSSVIYYGESGDLWIVMRFASVVSQGCHVTSFFHDNGDIISTRDQDLGGQIFTQL
jgi:hypothetical protein